MPSTWTIRARRLPGTWITALARFGHTSAHTAQIDGQPQEALHAVHMEHGVRAQAVPQRGDLPQGLYAADLVVDLHHTDHAHVR
jgi:hypothetical protein